MSLIIKGMKMPKHFAVNGEKDTAYKCVVLAHPDNTVELVIDTKFASPYDNGHNVQRYPLSELPTPHGRLIDADYIDGSGLIGWQKSIVKAEISQAPTIIEAEGVNE